MKHQTWVKKRVYPYLYFIMNFMVQSPY